MGVGALGSTLMQEPNKKYFHQSFKLFENSLFKAKKHIESSMGLLNAIIWNKTHWIFNRSLDAIIWSKAHGIFTFPFNAIIWSKYWTHWIFPTLWISNHLKQNPFNFIDEAFWCYHHHVAKATEFWKKINATIWNKTNWIFFTSPLDLNGCICKTKPIDFSKVFEWHNPKQNPLDFQQVKVTSSDGLPPNALMASWFAISYSIDWTEFVIQTSKLKTIR